MIRTSAFQKAIESVESLSIEDQEILLDIIYKNYNKHRTQLSQEIREIGQEFTEGIVRCGSVDQFLEKLDQQ